MKALHKALDIIFQDEHLVAIRKPPMIHSVMLPDRSGGASIASLLIELNPDLKDVSDKEEDAGLINRLDFETSGILLLALSSKIQGPLKEAFFSESAIKSYVMIAEGRFPDRQVVENFIGTSNRKASKVKVFDNPRKKDRALPARTDFGLIAWNKELDCSLVRAFIQRGRRHQLRAHAAFLGHALIGDAVYGSSRPLSSITGEDQPGFFLHAESVKFTHPVTGKLIQISCEAPGEISALFQEKI